MRDDLGIDLRLTGQANDYVAKGLSGGRITVAPESDLIRDYEREHRQSCRRQKNSSHVFLLGLFRRNAGVSGPPPDNDIISR